MKKEKMEREVKEIEDNLNKRLVQKAPKAREQEVLQRFQKYETNYKEKRVQQKLRKEQEIGGKMRKMFTPATNQKFNNKIAEKSYIARTKGSGLQQPTDSKVIYEENES